MSFSDLWAWKGGAITEVKTQENWYRYRPDLWKRVIFADGHSGAYRDLETDEEGRERANIRRAQRTIEAYALCNDWDWFGTFTLDPLKRDRTDLDGFRKYLMRFMRRRGIKVLLVPELHRKRDGWHMHGLLKELDVTELREFDLSEKLPVYIRRKLLQGADVYDWPAYRDAFGFVDIEPLQNRDAAARYITKYCSKASEATADEIASGKHLYYASKGLKLPEKMDIAPVGAGAITGCNLVQGNSYSYDFGSVTWFSAVVQE